jgi:tetratricopeptide (TPR) repeat protein
MKRKEQKWDEFILEAAEAFDEDRYTDVIKNLDKAEKAGCKDLMLKAMRAHSNVHLHNYEDALVDIEFVLEKDKDNLSMIYYRCIVNLDLNKHEAALIAIERLVEVHPDDSESYCLRGICLSYLNEFERAIKDLTLAKKMGSEEPLICRQRGLSYFSLEKYKEAKADLIAYTVLDDQDHYIFFLLNIIAKKEGKLHDAIEYVSRAIYLKEGEFDYYMSRFNLYKETEQYDKWGADLNKAIALNPEGVGVRIGGEFKSISDIINEGPEMNKPKKKKKK